MSFLFGKKSKNDKSGPPERGTGAGSSAGGSITSIGAGAVAGNSTPSGSGSGRAKERAVAVASPGPPQVAGSHQPQTAAVMNGGRPASPEEVRGPELDMQHAPRVPVSGSPAPGGSATGAAPTSAANSTALYPWSQRRLTFTSPTAMPFPRYGAAVNATASKEGEIYLMGGLINGSTVKGDLWMIESGGSNLACYPVATTFEGPGPRVGHASLLVGNAFIVFGGDTKMDEHDQLDDTLYLLNTSTRHWSRSMPPGPRPAGRYGHTLNILGSKIYVFGGQVEGFFFNDLIAFDLNALQNSSSKWEMMIPSSAEGGPPKGMVPPARTNHTIITWNDKMFLFGGTNGTHWFSDVWSYDPKTVSWTQLDCIGYIPAAREGHSAALVGDVMYIFGGRTEEGIDLGDLAAFRITSRRWYTFQNMGPSPSPRSGHSMTAYGKQIVVLAGEPSSAPREPAELSLMYVLDTSKIRYPNDQQLSNTAATSDRAPGARRPSQDRPGGPFANRAPNGAPMEANRKFSRESMLGNVSQTRSVPSAAARAQDTNPNMRGPRLGAGQAPSGPPPLQQAPPPRANGTIMTAPGPRARTPTKFPGDHIREDSAEADLSQATVMPGSRSMSPIVNGRRTPQSQSQRHQMEEGDSPSTALRSRSRQDAQHEPSRLLQHEEVRQEGSRDAMHQNGQLDREFVQQEPLRSGGRGLQEPLRQDERGQQESQLHKEALDSQDSQQRVQPTQLSASVQTQHAGSLAQHANLHQSLTPQLQHANIQQSATPQSQHPGLNQSAPSQPQHPGVQKQYEEMASEYQALRSRHKDTVMQSEALQQELDFAKSRNAWYASELSLAKEAGFQFSGEATEQTIRHLNEKEKPLVEALVAMRVRLQEVQRTMADREGMAAQHMAEIEYQRDNAIKEAALAKAKLAAHGGNDRIIDESDHGKKLADALHAQQELQATIRALGQEIEHEKRQREIAEKSSRAIEQQKQALDDSRGATESLRAEVYNLSRLAREETAAKTEAQSQLHVLQIEHKDLSHQIEEMLNHAKQHDSGIGALKEAVNASQDRASLFEKKLDEERQKREAVDRRLLQLRSEHEERTAELDETTRKLRDAEDMAAQHVAEANTHRQALIEGLNKLGSRSLDHNRSLDDKRVPALKEQLEQAHLLMRKHQADADKAAERLRGAEERVSGLEAFQEQSSRENLSLRRQLQESLTATQTLKTQQVDVQAQLVEHQREVQAASIKQHTLRELFNGGEGGDDIYEGRIKELEEQLDASFRAHQDTKESSEMREAETEKTYREKLELLETDYKKAVHYVKGTEKMLKRMKDELDKCRKQNDRLRSDLDEAQSPTNNWDEERAALRQEIDQAQHRAQQVENQLGSLQTEVAAERERMHTEHGAELDQLKAENNMLETRAYEAEQKVTLLLDQVSTSVGNYRRQSHQHGHSRNLSTLSTTSGISAANPAPLHFHGSERGHAHSESAMSESTAGPDVTEGINRNSQALDSLASELEALRAQWADTHRNYRNSNQYDFDRSAPASASGAGQMSDSLASWRKRLEEEEGSATDPTTDDERTPRRMPGGQLDDMSSAESSRERDHANDGVNVEGGHIGQGKV